MSKIRIKNFGPIKEGYQDDDGWMDVKKVTVFIGNQASGKSTIAKLVSTLSWLEKALYRGDVREREVTGENFINYYCAYQGVKNYFLPNTEIEYKGDAYFFHFINQILTHGKVQDIPAYRVPKIMYVPAERNFLSTISDAFNVSALPKPLHTFSEELKRAQLYWDRKDITLPINGLRYEYDSATEISKIKGENYDVDLLEASSGLQSSIPLYLVSFYLMLSIVHGDAFDQSKANMSVNQEIRKKSEIGLILQNANLSDEEKNKEIERIYEKYRNSCFINIVEEIEQNLFPISQGQMLNSLVGFLNMNEANKLILTTHSPYIINFLSIAVQGDSLKRKIQISTKSQLLTRLEKVVPLQSTISSADIVIYELQDGKIIRLPDYEGVPSDKNYLNQSLAEGNRLFDSLLEIEQEI